MEPLVPGHLEALSAGGKKSGAAGTNSPARRERSTWPPQGLECLTGEILS